MSDPINPHVKQTFLKIVILFSTQWKIYKLLVLLCLWIKFFLLDRCESAFAVSSVACGLSLRTPCKIIPTVNNILSARKPCRDDTPLKRLLEHQLQQKEGEASKDAEKSMYCKELLFSGTTEFSLEELRAELYFKKKNSQAVVCPGEPATDTETK